MTETPVLDSSEGEELKPPPTPARTITGRFVAVLVVIVLVIAAAVVSGFGVPVLVGLGLLGLLAPFARRWFRRLGAETLPQVYSIAAIYAAMASTFVLRQRSAESLVENPFDAAGRFRLAALVVALGLAGISLLLNSLQRIPKLPGFFLVFVAYVALTAPAIISAVSPSLVMFRTFELSVFCLVFLSAYSSFRATVWVPLRNVMIMIYLLLGSAFVSLALNPQRAWFEAFGFRPRLKGVYPNMSANYLGVLACLCVAYGLGSRRIRWGPVLLGVVVAGAAQHRTGLLAIGALVILRMLLSRRSTATAAAIGAIGLLFVVGSLGVVSDGFNRGQDAAEVATLSSRTDWWEAGLTALGRSPVVGLGLSSGARFEVFAGRGQFEVNVPNLHSTWLEALVGTGIVGATLLVISYGSALWGAVKAMIRGRSRIPLYLLVALGINSLTHTTFELASMATLVFLFAGTAAFTAPDPGTERRRRITLWRPEQPATLPGRIKHPARR